jgi:hypothetical protein
VVTTFVGPSVEPGEGYVGTMAPAESSVVCAMESSEQSRRDASTCVDGRISSRVSTPEGSSLMSEGGVPRGSCPLDDDALFLCEERASVAPSCVEAGVEPAVTVSAAVLSELPYEDDDVVDEARRHLDALCYRFDRGLEKLDKLSIDFAKLEVTFAAFEAEVDESREERRAASLTGLTESCGGVWCVNPSGEGDDGEEEM